jgi:hypothetical protein
MPTSPDSATPTIVPYTLRRHGMALETHFDFSLVLTFAFPARVLAPLLSPGLILDTYVPPDAPGNPPLAFIAIAMVQSQKMRPRGWPKAAGQDYMLIGYRVFVRYKTRAGQHLRGLKILRSDVNSHLVATAGNAMTHYNFHYSKIKWQRDNAAITLTSKPSDKLTTLDVKAHLNSIGDDYLPDTSPFANLREALKFAGPMPFTFDYEKETDSIIRVEGVRKNWQPKTLAVDVGPVGFFSQPPFNQVDPIFCSAFYIADVPYMWRRGFIEKVMREGEV